MPSLGVLSFKHFLGLLFIRAKYDLVQLHQLLINPFLSDRTLLKDHWYFRLCLSARQNRNHRNMSHSSILFQYSHIQKNPEWEFADICTVDGISGTNTKKREDFNRMINDCEAENIDMIITMSIRRFSRNTQDCLKYNRKLKEKKISISSKINSSIQWTLKAKY